MADLSAITLALIGFQIPGTSIAAPLMWIARVLSKGGQQRSGAYLFQARREDSDLLPKQNLGQEYLAR